MKDISDRINNENKKFIRIINAAIQIFSKNDYEKASTTMIVKKAGISRGLLYHYFKSKKELFDFLIDYIGIKVILETENKFNWDETDFLKRIRQMTIQQFNLISKYPFYMEFAEKYSKEFSKRKNKNNIKDTYRGFKDKFFNQNMDLSMVKENVNKEEMIKVIDYTIRGIIKEYLNRLKVNQETFNTQTILLEIDKYLSFFRKHFYK